MATSDINRNLDVVALLRRLRIYGFAISILLNPEILNVITSLSEKKPLKEYKKTKITWKMYESFSLREKFAIVFLKKYREKLKMG